MGGGGLLEMVEGGREMQWRSDGAAKGKSISSLWK